MMRVTSGTGRQEVGFLFVRLFEFFRRLLPVRLDPQSDSYFLKAFLAQLATVVQNW